jgi:hypothetical protein
VRTVSDKDCGVYVCGLTAGVVRDRCLQSNLNRPHSPYTHHTLTIHSPYTPHTLCRLQSEELLGGELVRIDCSAEGLSIDCSAEGLSIDCSAEGLSIDCSIEGAPPSFILVAPPFPRRFQAHLHHSFAFRGEEGYFRILRGQDMCRISSQVHYHYLSTMSPPPTSHLILGFITHPRTLLISPPPLSLPPLQVYYPTGVKPYSPPPVVSGESKCGVMRAL